MRRYDDEFKREAMRKVFGGQTVGRFNKTGHSMC